MDNTATITPMMAQWKACKQQAKDALLLFRLGDFYEAFHDDAVLISKEISLTLTARQGIPMCGVPFSSCDATIDKLIAKGYKIAIAEQMEDPTLVKGLVKREIVRIVSPGTLINSQLLSDKKNNYFVSLAYIGSLFGLAALDISTGEFRSIETEKVTELLDELHRLRPSEILTSRKCKQAYPSLFSELSHSFSFVLNEQEEWRFEPKSATSLLLSHFKVQTLDHFGLKGTLAAVCAGGALLSYLRQELNLCLDHVTSIRADLLQSYMAIDRSTMKNLELVESLFPLIDQTGTPMGARLLCDWIKHPLLSISAIYERQDAIADLLAKDSSLCTSLLQKVRDLERLMMRISSRCGSPRDLLGLGLSLLPVLPIKQSLEPFTASMLVLQREHLFDPISEKIVSSLVSTPPLRLGEGDIFRDGYHPELDRLRALSRDSLSWIHHYQAQLREQTGIKTLKISYTKAFGYFIEVSRAQGEKIPPGFQRKQTLVNAERFMTEELKQFEHQILTAEERAKALEAQLFEELRTEIVLHANTIYKTAKAIAHLDALASLSIVAKQYQWTRPTIDDSDRLHIYAGRHPIVEQAIGTSAFIANDTFLSNNEQLMLITGPNMAGKSTYIRQVALLVILAQMGCYIPATSAHIGIIDKIFSRIGASDDLARGQSTFMVEMTETANILQNATSRSLVLLDEIGRGTSTYDGIAIAWSVAEYLLTTVGKQAKTLFATHYWELTKLEQEFRNAKNYQIAIEETTHNIVFLRKIIPGGTHKSYGIHVAKLAGIPYKAIKRAEEMLLQLEMQKPRAKKQDKIADQLSLLNHDI